MCGLSTGLSIHLDSEHNEVLGVPKNNKNNKEENKNE